ncbi:MAG: flavodoxin family protein [Candidatus Thorarchaeota archaeon]
MDALILNGMESVSTTGLDLLEAIKTELDERKIRCNVINLKDHDIAHCRGCFDCWVKTPGECVIDDFGREVAMRVIQSDLVIYLSPVTFGGYSSVLKKAIDRNICLVHPYFIKIEGEYHHKKRYNTYPRLIGIGTLENHDDRKVQLFKTLITRNALNMHSSSHASDIVYDEQESDAIRTVVSSLLVEVEVFK